MRHLPDFLTLKTIVLGDVLPVINSNRLICCIACNVAMWSVRVLCNEKTVRRDCVMVESLISY